MVKGVKTAKLTGTAILAALVIVFDYSLKFSGLKIPFPWMPFLKFDFTGVPIVISFLLFGTSSSAITSTIACLGIVLRSGELVGGVMKGIAEFSTVLGIALGLRFMSKFNIGIRSIKMISIALGVLLRILSMSVWNLIVLPNYYGLPLGAVVSMLPLLGVFNGIQGTITAFIGYMLYEAYTRHARCARARALAEDAQVVATDAKATGSSYVWLAVVLAVVAVVVVAVFYMRRRAPPPVEKLEKVDLGALFKEHPHLRLDDKEVIRYLATWGGESFAAEIRERFGVPRTSLWRMIRRARAACPRAPRQGCGGDWMAGGEAGG